MKTALAALIDLLSTRTAKEKETLKTMQWYRHNANARRALPSQPDESDSNSILGVLSAIATRQEVSSRGSGEAGKPADSGAGTTNVEVRQTTTTDGGHPVAGSSGQGADRPGGQDPAGGSQAEPGAGGKAAAGTGGGGSGRSGLSSLAKTAIAVGAIAGTGGLGLAGLTAYNALTSDRGDTIINQQTGEYPLLDWLEEHGYHLPEGQ